MLMDTLVAAYPAFLAGHDDRDLIWKDGTRSPFSDGSDGKSVEERLAAPSIKDMFFAAYRAGNAGLSPAPDVDPGRARNEPFFLKMYGDCRKGETLGSLTDVVWLPKKWGKTLKVTTVNGVAEELTKTSAELDALPSAYDQFLLPPAGTYNCRTIAGTNRLSAHAGATAIDIATKHANYWYWQKPDASGHYAWRNQIPLEIVAIFEKHGFIWGGKWYHYDTMHFEYRPELIAADRLP